MVEQPEGFRELEHTADWEIEVWAQDLPLLFEQAARGMYSLSGIELSEGPRKRHSLELSAVDHEVLLVDFLQELLFLAEDQNLAFDEFDLRIEDAHLSGELEGAPIAKHQKEIKAVTFHHLNIRETEGGRAVNIVFDV